ncbi:MAG: hypothetical protein JNK89_11335 [Saprospiraceae bacterium]|nr:hypothetical protein [Saprospiraceae bacterium]
MSDRFAALSSFLKNYPAARIGMLLLLIAAPAGSFSQVFMRPFDPSNVQALGSAAVAYPGNAAGLANDAAPGLGDKMAVFLGTTLPYGISGWHTAQFQALAGLGPNDGLGLEINYSAIETYTEQQYRLVYGRRLGARILLGGSIQALRVSAQEYGGSTALTFGLSMLAEPLPGVWLGARMQNPLQLEMSGIPIPSVLRVGAAWKAASTLILLSELEKDLDRPAQVKAGVEYRPVAALALRLGLRTEPARLGFGAGFQLKNGIELNSGAEWHPVLGFSPSALLVWRRK